ncbi:MAG: hypothetical protein NZ765_06440 [Anaerolineae bacterium]|nr:hypothetical protein [Anaerolineae bacterium]MDW8070899.1 hypothetical protein [Anaerolineae bacterium]
MGRQCLISYFQAFGLTLSPPTIHHILRRNRRGAQSVRRLRV